MKEWLAIMQQIPSKHFVKGLLIEPQGARAALAKFSAEAEGLRYLEIGCRMGHSLALVALSAKSLRSATVVDLWVDNYGKEPNLGPGEVTRNLIALGVDTTKVRFLDGDSHDILPTLDEEFDLILVDGDHTPEGAARDIVDCLALLAPGGFLVFDDAVGELLDTWQAVTLMAGGVTLEEDHSANPPWCSATRRPI